MRIESGIDVLILGLGEVLCSSFQSIDVDGDDKGDRAGDQADRCSICSAIAKLLCI